MILVLGRSRAGGGLLGEVGPHEEATLAWQGLLHNHGRHVHSVLVCEVENVCRGQ